MPCGDGWNLHRASRECYKGRAWWPRPRCLLARPSPEYAPARLDPETRPMRRPCRHILAAGVLAVVLAACGDSTDPDSDPLPNNAATAVGLTVRDNVEASLDAFFPARLLQPFSTGPADDPCV